MALLRGYDAELGTVNCVAENCDYPVVQTIRMSCVPFSQEGDQIKASQVRLEFVPLCEGHYAYHWPTRAKGIPIRFIEGRDD